MGIVRAVRRDSPAEVAVAPKSTAPPSREKAFERVLERAQENGSAQPAKKTRMQTAARSSQKENVQDEGKPEEARKAEGQKGPEVNSGGENEKVEGQATEGQPVKEVGGQESNGTDDESGATVVVEVGAASGETGAVAKAQAPPRAGEPGTADKLPEWSVPGEASELLGKNGAGNTANKAASFDEAMQAAKEEATGQEAEASERAKPGEAGVVVKVAEAKVETAAPVQAVGEGSGAATIARQPAEVVGTEKVIGPPHATTNPQQENVARVAKGLYAAASAGGGAVTLRLSPPEMGIVRVEMQLQQGVVRAKLLAEQDSARDLLGQRVGELRLALERQGLVVERLQVEALPNHAPAPEGPRGEQGREGQQPPDGGLPQERQGRSREEQGRRSFEAELLNMVA